MAHSGRREASDIHPTNPRPVEEVILTPDYTRTLRWFINAFRFNSFESGAIDPIFSLLEQARYVHQTNPEEFQKILDELKAGKI